MKLLGKLYVSGPGHTYIHAKEDGKIYYVMTNGQWRLTSYALPPTSWRLVGDSYAKD